MRSAQENFAIGVALFSEYRHTHTSFAPPRVATRAGKDSMRSAVVVRFSRSRIFKGCARDRRDCSKNASRIVHKWRSDIEKPGLCNRLGRRRRPRLHPDNLIGIAVTVPRLTLAGEEAVHVSYLQ
jgi:hypothetical protein